LVLDFIYIEILFTGLSIETPKTRKNFTKVSFLGQQGRCNWQPTSSLDDLKNLLRRNRVRLPNCCQHFLETKKAGRRE